MLDSIRSFKPSLAVPRMLADFLLIHLSMIASIELALYYHSRFGDPATAGALVGNFARYYATCFGPVSVLFPVIFLLNGFYTLTRHYQRSAKALVVARGAGIALLVFLAANYLLFREHLVARSIALPFSLLAMGGLLAARLLKTAVTEYFDARERAEAGLSPGRSVLIVGGAGYIGSILSRQLVEKGCRVRILDNLVYGDGAIRDLLGTPSCELLTGDCRNIQHVVGAVRGVDAIIHLAAIVGDPACEQDRQTALEVNYAATRMLIEIAKGHGVRRLVFASSCSVYGATDELMDENSEVTPISLYAQTKVDSEKALLRARTDRFHPVIARLATVFGNSPRPRFDLVVNLLTAKARQEGLITIYNGQQWRPFIHVRDVARGLTALLEAPVEVVSGQIYNLGDSRLNYTLAQVAERIRAVFPATRIERVDNNDRRNYRVSFRKVLDQVGFECHWTLADGILELQKAFEERSIQDYTDPRYNNQKFLRNTGGPSHADAIDARVMAAFAAALESYESPDYEATAP